MVRLRTLVVVWCLASGAACEEGARPEPGKAPAAGAPAVDVEALQREESEFLARRQALSVERKKVAEDRAALVERRRQAAAQGGDLATIEQEETALAERQTQLDEKERELDKGYDRLVVQYQTAAAGAAAAGGGDPARREAQVAVREKDLARREEALARREGDLAAREKDFARREKEMCGGGSVTTIVTAAPAPATKGSRYTKRDVEPSLSKARKRMNEKGILASDLPAPAAALEREATTAMAEGDFGRAKFAADQFLANVEAVSVDRAFIAAKIGRLNAAMKGVQLADAKRRDVEDLFRGATADYGNGKFAAANGKLNKIWLLIRS